MTSNSSRSTRDQQVAVLLAQLRAAKAKRLITRGVTTGSVALVGMQGLAACSDEATSPETEDEAVVGPNVPAPGVDPGKSDWAQYEGERNTDIIQYRGDFYTEDTNCNSRFGCMTRDIILKVFVREQAGTNVDNKRVGAVFRFPDWDTSKTETALGSYFATNDGWEEWHVRIHVGGYSTGNPIAVFNAWYQDGLNNTYFDDNQGEFHIAAGHSPINHHTDYGQVTFEGGQAKGTLAVQVADLDYDKEIDLVYSTDGWQTVSVLGTGEGTNKWHWTNDLWNGMELFQMDLDVPCSERFEYAIVYRHGVVNNAKTYEFWANGGGSNYIITP